MKTGLQILLALLVLTSCGQKEIILSDELCLITHHEEFRDLAKDIQMEEKLLQSNELEKVQHSYSILNEGDEVIFKLPYLGDGDKGIPNAYALAAYYQRTFLKSKKVVYFFNDDSKNVKVKIASSELPYYFEQINFSLLVDQDINASDVKKLEVFSQDKSLPQEASFWLKKGKDGTYYCYTIFNDQTNDSSILQDIFSNSSDVVKKMNDLKLTQKVELQFMNLNYEILDIGS